MNYIETLDRVAEQVLEAEKLIIAEWDRSSGPRGSGDKAAVDIEIEERLRVALLEIYRCDFWGEETEASLSRVKYCWVVDGPLYANAMTLALPAPTDDTREILALAQRGLEQIFRPGYPFSKCSSC